MHSYLNSLEKNKITPMKQTYKRIFSAISLIFCTVIAFAQTYQVPSSGSTTVTGCSGVILDPGGSSSYPSSCNGYMLITSDQAGCMPHLTGNYHTESSYDYLYIYDGTNSNANQLAYCSGTGTVDVVSTTGSLYLYFHSDGSVTYDGFNLNLTCTGGCNCGGPIVTSSSASGRITLNWTATSGVTHYFIEYGPHGFTPGNGTRVRVTGTSYTITGLTDGTNYDVYVWFDCGDDNQITTESPTMISETPNNDFNVPASGSTTITACHGMLYDNGGPTNAYSNSNSGYAIIYPEEPSCVLHLEGTYNTENCCDHIYIYDGAGTGGTQLGQFQGTGSVDVTSTTGPLTVQFTTDGSVTYDGFAFEFSCRGGCTCGGSPYGIHVNQSANGVTVSWTESLDPTVQHYIIEYGPTGFTPGTGTTVVVSGNEYEITGLTTLNTYDIYVYYDCGDDGVVTTENPGIISFCVPDASACVDFTDLHASNITCTTGFTNSGGPYTTTGVVDNGYASSTSQHTIHYVSEPDPITGGGLQTVPPCELYSVRLGNWETSYGCESISYDFSVDTTEADILLLKYAAVLQNPTGHSDNEQPRFTFEILDQNSNQIDPVCGYANFVSGSTTTGWNQTTYGGETLYWKDWTYVGFDVSAYHGQTIRVRMTTYDCDQGGHFGYAYFTLNCKRRTITAETCGEMLTNTYTAPTGFNYQWYYERNPSQIISTEQSVTVTPTGDDMILCCHVTFVGNPNCGFDLTTTMTSRYPLASFAPERDSCSWRFNMNNTSTISADGVNPIGTNEPCETAHWDFGDGTTSDEYNPVHEFPGPGNYVVTMISGISNDECQDTTTYTIDLLGNYPVITGDTSLCLGEGTTLSATGGNTYHWSANGEDLGDDDHIYVEPETTTTYELNSFAADGCEVTITQPVIVYPTSTYQFVDSICQGERYNERGFNIPPQLSAGTFPYTIVVPNRYGCDSTVTVNLTVKPLPNTSLGRPFDHCFEDYGDAVLTVPESGAEYRWSNGATTQHIAVSEGGTYSVTATKDGCVNEGEITINDVCPFNIYLPNCITPTDNDGINDIFKLPSTKDIAEFEINIFDRWGRVVFRSTEPHFEWNGSVNGKIPSGHVYTYRIDLKTTGNEKKILSGSITVL